MNRYLITLGLLVTACSSFASEPGPAAPDQPPTAQKPFPHIAWRSDDGQSSLDVGGALRINYRDEHWDTTENNGR
ncbi:MAG TPA: hypothetical protein VES70_11535, partial [Pseudomonas sp.]|nr:hypothetical protein [Pseudomonas sp.]